MLAAEPSLEPLLTVLEVAGLLRISRPEVYRLVKTGDLTPVRVPYKKTLFRRDDIAQFMGVTVLQAEVL